MARTAIVLLSGGCDSTLMLHKLLKGSYGHHYKEIIPVYIYTESNHYIKSLMELAACESILDYMSRNKNDFRYCYEVPKLNVKLIGDINGGVGMSDDSRTCGPQLPMWLFTIMQSYYRFTSDVDIYVGLIHGDESHLTAYVFQRMLDVLVDGMKLWDAACDRRNRQYNIKTPFAQFNKDGILSEIRCDGFNPYVWMCEMPNEDLTPCGYCNKCKSMKNMDMYSKGITLHAQEWFVDPLTKINDLPGMKHGVMERAIRSSFYNTWSEHKELRKYEKVTMELSDSLKKDDTKEKCDTSEVKPTDEIEEEVK